jgi:hypothetical protein
MYVPLAFTLHNSAFCPQNKFTDFVQFSTSITSERLASSATCHYQKDGRALPGDLRSRKFICFPITPSVSRYPTFSSLSPFSSYGFKGLSGNSGSVLARNRALNSDFLHNVSVLYISSSMTLQPTTWTYVKTVLILQLVSDHNHRYLH